MQDFTKRANNGRDIRRFLLGICMVAFLGLLTFESVRAAWGMYQKFADAAASNQVAELNLAELKSQEATIQAEVTALSTPEGQEATLRESYGVALPGEGEIQIVRSSTTTAEAIPEPGNFFINIFRALFVW